MRLLAICEQVPESCGSRENGSTLISGNVLTRLPDDIELDLALHDDGDSKIKPELADRASRVLSLPMRPVWASWAMLPFTGLPRATWRRDGGHSREMLQGLADEADVVYAHGLHSFASALAATQAGARPLVVHEVDPWSEYWRQRARRSRPLRRGYFELQARRAARLERRTGEAASSYLLTSPDDARVLGRRISRLVTPMANGLTRSRAVPRAPVRRQADVMGFLGSLDYPPNIEAVTTLCQVLLPRVRERLPDVRLQIAGRRAGAAVRRLASPSVEIVGEVPDSVDFFRSVAVAAFPGDFGTGVKNTLMEALAAGTPVVASRTAARSVHDQGQLVVSADGERFVESLVTVLLDDDLRTSLSRAAQRWSEDLPSWEDVAEGFAAELRAAATAAAPVDGAGGGACRRPVRRPAS